MLAIDFQRPDLFASGDVPESEGAIAAARHEGLAVRSERDAADVVRVLQDEELFAGGQVPQPSGIVAVGGRGQDLAIRRKGNRADVAPMPVAAVPFRGGGDV